MRWPSPQSDADLDITVASRSARSFEAAQKSHPALRDVAFAPCDIDDTARLAEVLQARRRLMYNHIFLHTSWTPLAFFRLDTSRAVAHKARIVSTYVSRASTS